MYKRITLLLIMLVYLQIASVYAIDNPVIELNYTRTQDSAGITRINAWVSVMNESTLENLQGTFIVIETTPSGAVGENHDMTINSQPAWNLGDISALGANASAMLFTVPADNTTDVILSASIYRSLSAPIAVVAEKKITTQTGKPIVLDATPSYDIDGNPLTYDWAIESRAGASSEQLSATNVATPYFTPEDEGNYRIRVDVSDGVYTSREVVTVQVNASDPAPKAIAGPDQFGVVGDRIKFDARSSFDRLGETLTYSWSFIHIPKTSGLGDIDIDGVSVPGMGIFTPDIAGRYIVKLQVTDEGGKTTVDTVKAIISDGVANLPPVADAGDNVKVFTGQSVSLDGSGSFDPDGDTITYQWELVSAPDCSASTLNNTTTVSPDFSPDCAGVYQVILVVTDDGTPQLNSLPDMVTITVFDSDTGVVDPGVDPACISDLENAGVGVEPLPGELEIDSPVEGAVYPVDTPIDFHWAFTGIDPCAVEIILTYGLVVREIYTYDGIYLPSQTIWDEIASAPGGEATFTIKYINIDTIYEKSVTFIVSGTSPAGEIIFWGVDKVLPNLDGNIFSMPADANTAPKPIYGTITGHGCAGCHIVTPDGNTMVVNGYEAPWIDLDVVDISTPDEPVITNDSFDAESPVISWNPDYTKVLFSKGSMYNDPTDGWVQTFDLYTFNPSLSSSGAVAYLSNTRRQELYGVYVSDGSVICVVSSGTASINIRHINPEPRTEGATTYDPAYTSIIRVYSNGTERILVPEEAGFIHYYPAVDPTGTWLAYNRSGLSSYSSTDAEIWLVRLDDPYNPGNPGTPFKATGLNGEAVANTDHYGNSWATWSPDGEWIAFSSNRNPNGIGATANEDWSLFKSKVVDTVTGETSSAIPISGADSNRVGEHLPYWVNTVP